MKRETITRMLDAVNDEYISQTAVFDPGYIQEVPERIVQMKKKRIITFALAAALILALGVGAYAAGLFGGKAEITTTPVDPDDPAWEQALEDAPYANEWQYARWEPHNNLPTAEIEALLAEMEGKKEYSDRSFSTVSEMEKTYGIELLKLGKDERNVQGSLAFWDENDHSDGSLTGSWNSYEDGVYLFTLYSYFFNSPYISSSSGFGWTEIESTGEYEIKSLGVTASLVSGLIESDGRSERYICAAFAYGGIDYEITAILDPDLTAKDMLDKVTTDWLCEKLETLQKPSWVSETAGPVPEMAQDDEPNDSVSSGGSSIGVWWEPHNNLPTAEIEALLAEMEGKEEYSNRSFGSVSEMEKTYGIELLKLGDEECHVQAGLTFWDEDDHSAGAHLLGSWNSYEDGVYLNIGFSYFLNDPENFSSMGFDMTAREEPREYEIRSLGVTAQIVSGRVANGRVIIALFSYGGIDYHIEAILDPDISTKNDLGSVTADWLCEKLETLQKPSWTPETASPADENDSKVTVFSADDFPGRPVFDAEEAGPSGVIITNTTIDHNDPNWEDEPYANVYLYFKWAPHDNQPTAEMKAIAEKNKEERYLSQTHDSFDEIEKTYGIRLLQLGKDETNVVSAIWTDSSSDFFDAFDAAWSSTAEDVSIGMLARFADNSSGSVGMSLTCIDGEAEYEIRSLGVTARLVSGTKDSAEGTKRCVSAAFTCDGVDYWILATADEGQDISIDWLCALLETLHK